MANPLALITGLTTGKTTEFKGVVKRDWVATGRIDFATKLDSNADPEKPSEFRLLVEERRIIESIAGNENLEIQWRPATLKEAKFVTTHYHKYLSENSLIKTPFEHEILPPERKDKSA
jgi:ABC-type branched-subunit amino acid transport system ATPase component